MYGVKSDRAALREIRDRVVDVHAGRNRHARVYLVREPPATDLRYLLEHFLVRAVTAETVAGRRRTVKRYGQEADLLPHGLGQLVQEQAVCLNRYVVALDVRENRLQKGDVEQRFATVQVKGYVWGLPQEIDQHGRVIADVLLQVVPGFAFPAIGAVEIAPLRKKDDELHPQTPSPSAILSRAVRLPDHSQPPLYP